MTRTISIHADELRPGDVVDHGGRRHRITQVVQGIGASWPVAVDGTGWAIALGRQPLDVLRDVMPRRRPSPADARAA
jgi:hypothetical protein